MRNLVLLLTVLFLAGCAEHMQEYMKDGKQYGLTSGLFRHRWWNYYERGLSFAEGEFYPEALKDFKTAIEKRKDDQWRARTYGMHFINYFPHRELGIVYYRQKRFRDAIKELEASLDTAESAKAKYFLNRVRQSLLESTGTDRLPPTLTITQPLDHTISNKFIVTLSGVAKDDNYISTVRVNDRLLPLELSTEKFEFKTKVRLSEGANPIRVTAVDLTGKSTERILNIVADRRGPVISISDSLSTDHKRVLDGFISDATGIASLTVNGQEIAPPVCKEFAFKRKLPKGPITIVAKDLAGNTTTAHIADVKKAAIPSRLPLLAGIADTALIVSDAMPQLLALGLGSIMDTTPPVIAFEKLADFQNIYDKEILIEGRAEDESEIQSLTINQEQILRKKGKKVFFSQLQELKTGENEFNVVAQDAFHNSGARTITVNRKVEKVRQIGSRMTVAVLPLEQKGSSSLVGDAAYDSFISALHNQGRFKVVEREKLEDLLRELKLSGTEIVDPQTASKMGRIIAADSMITGTIVETEKSIEIIARLIDTESTVILSSNDVFDEEKGLVTLNKLLKTLAYKFKRDFPLLEGIILDIKGNEALVDLGKEKNIREHIKLIIFRDGPDVKHPVTGRVLGSEPLELGEAKVKDVLKEYSKAIVTKKTDIPKVTDRVITK